jgi:hypothetical protein
VIVIGFCRMASLCLAAHAPAAGEKTAKDMKGELLARLDLWGDQTDMIHADTMRHVYNLGN